MLPRTSIHARLNICDCLRWCRFINVYRTQTTIQWINRRRHCRSCVLYASDREGIDIIETIDEPFVYRNEWHYITRERARPWDFENVKYIIVEPRCCLDVNISTGSSDANETSYFVIRAYNSSYVQLLNRDTHTLSERLSAAYTVHIITIVHYMHRIKLNNFILIIKIGEKYFLNKLGNESFKQCF